MDEQMLMILSKSDKRALNYRHEKFWEYPFVHFIQFIATEFSIFLLNLLYEKKRCCSSQFNIFFADNRKLPPIGCYFVAEANMRIWR